MINKKTLAELAQKVINDFDLIIPINVEELCSRLNIAIIEKPLESADAVLQAKNGKVRIILREGLKDKRKFTIAHELGHYFIQSHNHLTYGCRIDELGRINGKKEEENEANCFASELIMPSSIITKQYKGIVDFSVIDKIAKNFEVSYTSAAIKTIDCGDISKALIFCFNGIYKWYYATDNKYLEICSSYNFTNLKTGKYTNDFINNLDENYLNIEIKQLNKNYTLILISLPLVED